MFVHVVLILAMLYIPSIFCKAFNLSDAIAANNCFVYFCIYGYTLIKGHKPCYIYLLKCFCSLTGVGFQNLKCCLMLFIYFMATMHVGYRIWSLELHIQFLDAQHFFDIKCQTFTELRSLCTIATFVFTRRTYLQKCREGGDKFKIRKN